MEDIPDPELERSLYTDVGELVFHIGTFPLGMHEDAFMDLFLRHDLNKLEYRSQLDACLAAIPYKDHVRIQAIDRSGTNATTISDFLEVHRKIDISDIDISDL